MMKGNLPHEAVPVEDLPPRTRLRGHGHGVVRPAPTTVVTSAPSHVREAVTAVLVPRRVVHGVVALPDWLPVVDVPLRPEGFVVRVSRVAVRPVRRPRRLLRSGHPRERRGVIVAVLKVRPVRVGVVVAVVVGRALVVPTGARVVPPDALGPPRVVVGVHLGVPHGAGAGDRAADLGGRGAVQVVPLVLAPVRRRGATPLGAGVGVVRVAVVGVVAEHVRQRRPAPRRLRGRGGVMGLQGRRRGDEQEQARRGDYSSGHHPGEQCAGVILLLLAWILLTRGQKDRDATTVCVRVSVGASFFSLG
mmetsp:Transcript_13772/g.32448  ORF Transcript_13772/g.32448 Transcript_13772/m.32448 type:complete len:304 (+) Transcript_13772:196-1107(+)